MIPEQVNKFFDLDSKGLFEKAQRDYKSLTEEGTHDNIFNFFVTAYHLKDYIKYQYHKNENNIRAFGNMKNLLNLAGFIANKGKHLKVDPKYNNMETKHKPSIKYDDDHSYDDEDLYFDETFMIEDSNGDRHSAYAIAKELLTEWENYMKHEGIL